MKNRLLPVLVVPFAVALGATSASAQSASRFEARYRQGNEFRARHEDAHALEVFDAIWAESHEARARAQIGFAEAALGRWLLAEAHLNDALAASTDPWIVRNRAVIESTLGTVRERLGSLEVVCPTTGAELWMGDRRVAALPVPQPVRVVAGSVQFEVRAPGRASASRTAVVPPNGFARESIEELPRLLASNAPVGPAAAQREGWVAPTSEDAGASSGGVLRSPWFWTAVGVVVVGGVATGVVLATRSGESPYAGNLSPGSVTVR